MRRKIRKKLTSLFFTFLLGFIILVTESFIEPRVSHSLNFFVARIKSKYRDYVTMHFDYIQQALEYVIQFKGQVIPIIIKCLRTSHRQLFRLNYEIGAGKSKRSCSNVENCEKKWICK